MFAKATDALAAASAAREALADGPIRVRMGLHTGEPTGTDEGYVGIDVHRAARIAAAGHGGQILLSQATRDLAGGSEMASFSYLVGLSDPPRELFVELIERCYAELVDEQALGVRRRAPDTRIPQLSL